MKEQKIKIKILNKKGIISSRNINKSSKFKYEYNRGQKAYQKLSDKIIKEKIEIIRIQKERKKFEKTSKRREKRFKKEAKKFERKAKKEFIEKKEKELEKEKITQKDIEKAGYVIQNYGFICKVSDRILYHNYSINKDVEDLIETLHNNDYPDHHVQDYNFVEEKFITYGKIHRSENDVTKKQIQFMEDLGIDPVLISSTRTKNEASKLINKYNR